MNTYSELVLAGALTAGLSEAVTYTRVLKAYGFDWPQPIKPLPLILATAINVVSAGVAVFIASWAMDVITTMSGAVILGFAFPKALETFFGSAAGNAPEPQARPSPLQSPSATGQSPGADQ